MYPYKSWVEALVVSRQERYKRPFSLFNVDKYIYTMIPERRIVDRRDINSRIDLLEFRAEQNDEDIKEIRKDHQEMLKILRQLQSDHDRTRTVLGGAWYIAMAAASLGTVFIGHLVDKFWK
jgi:hypothetical protein